MTKTLQELLDERMSAFDYMQGVGSANTYGLTPEARSALDLEYQSAKMRYIECCGAVRQHSGRDNGK